MTCPRCGYEHLRPYDVRGPIRFYRCWRRQPECGHEFQTIERLYHPDAHGAAQRILEFRRGVLEIAGGSIEIGGVE